MGVLNVIGTTSMLLLFLVSMNFSEAGRVLLGEEENSTMKNRLFGLTDLKAKGSPPPAGPNPPTNIPSPTPGNGHHAASTINQRNFAGHTTTENSTKNKLFVLMESKQMGPAPPGGPNPGTNKPAPPHPTNGHAASTINQRNFAGLLHMRTLASGFHC